MRKIFLIVVSIFWLSTAGALSKDLGPKIRSQPLKDTEFEVSTREILPFMRHVMVVENDRINELPYILGEIGKQVVRVKDDIVPVQGLDPESSNKLYTIVNITREYKDPETKESIGHEAMIVGSARLINFQGDIAMMRIESINDPVYPGFKIIPRINFDYPETLKGKYPESGTKGEIVGYLSGLEVGGNHDPIVVNIGKEQGLIEGTVLDILRKGSKLSDPKDSSKAHFLLAHEKIGQLMLYQVHDNVSIGLIFNASGRVDRADIVAAPEL